MIIKYGDSNLPVIVRSLSSYDAQNGYAVEKDIVYDISSVPDFTKKAYIDTVKAEPIGCDLVKVTLSTKFSNLSADGGYQNIDITGGTEGEGEASTLVELPEDIVESTSSTFEQSIERHPKFVLLMAQHYDFENRVFRSGTPYVGLENYVVGTVSVTVTTYHRSAPSDPYAEIGTIQIPGHGYTDANKWLLIGTSRREESNGEYWSLAKTYQYSALGWNTDVYTAGT